MNIIPVCLCAYRRFELSCGSALVSPSRCPLERREGWPAQDVWQREGEGHVILVCVCVLVAFLFYICTACTVLLTSLTVRIITNHVLEAWVVG